MSSVARPGEPEEPTPEEVYGWSLGEVTRLRKEFAAAETPEDVYDRGLELVRGLLDHVEFHAANADVLGPTDGGEAREIVAVAPRILSCAPTPKADAEVRLVLGVAHAVLHHLHGAAEDLELAVALQRDTVPLLDDDRERAGRSFFLAELILTRYGESDSPDVADLLVADGLYELALAQPELAELHEQAAFMAALATDERWDRLPADDPALREATDRAIANLDRARALVTDPEERLRLGARSGRLRQWRHLERDRASGDPDLDPAIDLLRPAVAAGCAEPMEVMALGQALELRYARDEDPMDRDAALAAFEAVIRHPDVSADRHRELVADCRIRCGELRVDRFQSERNRADLHQAAVELRAARDALERGTDLRFDAVHALATVFLDEPDDGWRPHEVAECVETMRELLETAPEVDREWQVAVQLQLFGALGRRMAGLQQWVPELDDLVPTLEAAAAERPDDPELQAVAACGLGIVHAMRVTVGLIDGSTDPADAERASYWLELCLTSPMLEEEQQAWIHGVLGMLSFARYYQGIGWHAHMGVTGSVRGVTDQFVHARLSPDIRKARHHLEIAHATQGAAPPQMLTLLRILDQPEDWGAVSTPEILARIEELESFDRAELGPMATFLDGIITGLYTMVAGRSRDRALVDQVVRRIRTAMSGTMPGGPDRTAMSFAYGWMLLFRATLSEAPDDAVEAVTVLRAAADPDGLFGGGLAGAGRTLARGVVGVVCLGRAIPEVDLTIGVLERLVARPDDAREILAELYLALGAAWSQQWRQGRTGAREDAGRCLRQALELAGSPSGKEYPVALVCALMHAHNGTLTNTADEFRRAEECLREAADRAASLDPSDSERSTVERLRSLLPELGRSPAPELLARLTAQLWAAQNGAPPESPFVGAHPSDVSAAGPLERSRRLAADGAAELERYRRTGAAAALDAAVDQLAHATATMHDYRPTAETARTYVQLAEAHHRRGDAAEAAVTGQRALREYSRAALLTDDTEARLALAREANQEVERLVERHLDRGDVNAAITDLEIGRALVLHATTLTGAIPDLLRRSGSEELAVAWEHGDGDRHAEALAAVSRSPVGVYLLAPPEPERITRLAWASGSDALVYLVPGRDAAGSAVLVRSDGTRTSLTLPGLRFGPQGPLARFRAAHRAAFRGGADVSRFDFATDPAALAWRAALDDLADCAFEVAMGPLLAETGRWGLNRTPRLVFVPSGGLNDVPWHAAYRFEAGERRYACADAVISYAASGRQLDDVTRRRQLPLGSAVALVANPTGTQVWPVIAARAVRAAFHPGAAYLGRPRGDSGGVLGTPQEVLDLLPGVDSDGASLLQLSSHADVHESPTRSHFELAGGALLSVAEILERAAGRRPDAPGGLVICDSCMTDLTEGDHDEVLTLSTALLAAGAVSVIGARWPLDDRLTAVMTFELHRRLAAGARPADALRETQLWMLQPDRRPAAEMPDDLRKHASLPELAEPFAWASFTHQGQ